MDKRNSLGRRYSFNIAQGDPIAESTHLNGNSFSWGSSMSPKYRSYSSLYLNDTQSPSSYVNGSILSCKTKNLTKIDARIAADIQSKGLASRIVKYHESGTRLNRSMSAHNLYSRPGQFPAVTLKKTALPYRAAKQELSMIRIPTPEKSSFYGNTISGLLRSSSVIGLQSKRNEDLSRENRPIIHPPPTEDDMAPTRSVLDVLKEISRKRINSDNLESEEASKKYCSRGGNDFVHTVNNKMVAIQSNYTTPTSCQRYKRQRDCITPHHDVPLSETQKSPEQAKKRVCNYNNDITSSLSSSKKWKKISASPNLNHTMPTNLESYEMQKSKVNQYQDYCKNKTNIRVDMRFDNLENNLGIEDAINPITPIPETPRVQDQTDVGSVAPERKGSEPFNNSDKKTAKNLTPSDQKPRLTLFNKKCDDSEKVLTTNESSEFAAENTDDSIETNDCAGIAFVKPKKITSKSGLRNPLMLRAQKSKLALMLSGLRGELYVNSDIDEFDSPKEDKQKHQSPTVDNSENKIASAVISSAKSTNTVVTLTTVTSTSTSNVETPPITSNLLNLSTNTSSSPPSTNSSAKKTSSPLVGLKLSSNTPPKIISNFLFVDATKSTETQSKPNVPVLGGFSLSTTNSNLIANTSSPNNITVEVSKTTTTPTLSVPTSSNNILNFGQSPASLTLGDKNNKLPFKMPPSTTSTTESIASVTPNSLTISKNFTFGSNVDTSTPVGAANTPFNSSTKPNNDFNFTFSSLAAPDKNSGPIMFGTSTCSKTLATNTTTSSIPATSTNAIPFGAVVTSENLSGSTTTPSFTFNTNKETSTSEAKTNSSAINSLNTFDTKFGSANKTQLLPSSSFTFGSDTKSLNSSKGGQSTQEVCNRVENKTSNIFDSQIFNQKPAVTFGNVTNSFENVSNTSNIAPNFVSSSLKPETQIFGTNTNNNKTGVLVTPTIFGSNNTSNSTTNLFNFGAKSAKSPTTNSNNVSSPPGGFSFTSAISNSQQSKTSGSNGQTNILTNTFRGSSHSDSKNTINFGTSNNKVDNSTNIFGGAINKQAENTTSPGGFSFGSETSMKSTFTFGTGNNSSAIAANSSSNPASGFSFGAPPAAAKSNEISSSKPFSFGSPPSTQQQKQIQSASASNGSSSNIFGLSSVNNNKTVPSTAFNFTGSSQNLQPNATNNVFAASHSGISTGPGDRPIRRATRRLQK